MKGRIDVSGRDHESYPEWYFDIYFVPGQTYKKSGAAEGHPVQGMKSFKLTHWHPGFYKHKSSAIRAARRIMKQLGIEEVRE